MKEYLFSLNRDETLSSKIKSLSKFQLQGVAGSTIVSRGYSYFYDGAVYDDVEIELGKIELNVSGSMGMYDVEISQKGHKVEAECDCPYDDGVCKHIIASLLHLQNNVLVSQLEAANITANNLKQAKSKENAFENYVNSLSIEALRALVLEFAPDSYRKEIEVRINIQQGNKKTVNLTFQKAQRAFDNLDVEDNNPDGFEEEVNEACEELRPYFSTFPDEITRLICEFFEKVNTAFDEGYLYDHYSDYSYEAIGLATFIGEFIAAIPNEKRAKTIKQILNAKKNMDYGVADNLEMDIVNAIKEEDWKDFKDIALEIDFLSSLRDADQLELYNKIKPYLDFKEQEKILKSQPDSSYLNLELARLYQNNNEPKKAFSVLENYLKTKNNDSFFFYRSSSITHQQFQLLIELSEKHYEGEPTLKWLNKYISTEPSIETFQFAIKKRPNERQAFETLFEKNHTSVYVQILEEENRLAEVVSCFKKYERTFLGNSYTYGFFQRHKQLFPTEAKAVFKANLDEVLPHTGDRNYHKVAEYLEQLKPILKESEFIILVKSIKEKYYRRRNLLGILSRNGL